MVPEIEVIVKMWPLFCCAHHGQHGPGHVHGAEGVRLELLLDELEGGLLEQSELAVAGVVDEHVDAAEAGDGGLDAGVGLLLVGDVERQGEKILRRADGGLDGLRLCVRWRRRGGRRRVPP